MTAIAVFYALPEVVGFLFLGSSVFAFFFSMALMIAPLLGRLKGANQDSKIANEMIHHLSLIAICSVAVFLTVGLAQLFRVLVR